MYDTLGRPVSASVIVDGAEKLQLQNEYNANNQLIKQFRLLPDKTITTTFAYDDNGRLTTYNSGTGDSSTLTYDSLNRLSTVTDHTNQRTYSYADGAEENTTTTRVSRVTYTGAGSGSGFTPLTYTYTYDSRGNILTISDPISGNRSYEYDALGQMTKETIGGTTYTYTYDTVGNLTSYNGIILSYTDSVWQDRLTRVTLNPTYGPIEDPIPYNGGLLDGGIIVEEEIGIIVGGAQVYDEAGNPTSYANGTARWNFTWDGRELKTAVPQGIGSSVSYTYDENGLRTTKTVGDTTHTYLYAADGTLIRETRSNGDTMEFLYDHAGQPYALILNGTVYYYVVNLQGDVVRIVDESGNTVVSYVYNAWGKSLPVNTNTDNDFVIASADISNPTISNAEIVAEMNPLRYRGYYYDTDTGFYYLQSRYYDPNLGRFINADSYASTGQGLLGNNMFAYCRNNPVCRKDIPGTTSVEIFDNEFDPTDDDNKFGGGHTGGSNSYKVSYNGWRSSIYRGGNDFTVKSNEVKMNPQTGNVKTSHGISLDVNPEALSKFGGAYRIETIPEGLNIIQRGSRAEHFEIVPAYEMPLVKFQGLLNHITFTGPYWEAR